MWAYARIDTIREDQLELFKKAHSDVYNSTLSAYGSYDRMARYSDFSEMEATPEISSALDIYAEECVSQDVEGQVLHIYSENRMIKQLLNELFYDILNIDFNLVMWVRNLCKYGDFFLFNDNRELVYRGQFDASRPKNTEPVTGADLRQADLREVNLRQHDGNPHYASMSWHALFAGYGTFPPEAKMVPTPTGLVTAEVDHTRRTLSACATNFLRYAPLSD